MQKPHRIIRPATRNVGDPSSKYAYDRDGKQFEADIQANHERNEALWKEFREWMISHEVDPRKFRYLFTQYYEEFVKGW